MNRFMGMMPSDEVKISKEYLDEHGLVVLIESGDNGYTILLSDGSSIYDDISDNAENNFEKALKVATKKLGKLRIDNRKNKEEV